MAAQVLQPTSFVIHINVQKTREGFIDWRNKHEIEVQLLLWNCNWFIRYIYNVNGETVNTITRKY